MPGSSGIKEYIYIYTCIYIWIAGEFFRWVLLLVQKEAIIGP